MATARYFPLVSGAPVLSKALNGRSTASLAAGVAILSALTVFLGLCRRDDSLLASANTSAYVASTPIAPVQQAPIVRADTQPAPDTITRVTVPMTSGSVATSGAVADEGNPIIAKSHGDLVALERRGVRRYVEFTLARSRRFQRVGPISVGVWRIDARHKVYDLCVLADNHRVDRKHVALYSPIRIASNEYTRPLEFVVNSIDRDGISGYISEPKLGR